MQKIPSTYPDVLTEEQGTLSRSIEYLVTNGRGYGLPEEFSSERVKNTPEGLNARLAQMEANKQIPLLRATYFGVLNNLFPPEKLNFLKLIRFTPSREFYLKTLEAKARQLKRDATHETNNAEIKGMRQELFENFCFYILSSAHLERASNIQR